MLYLGEPVPQALVDRLTTNGGLVVTARNPYWDHHGVRIMDPDGLSTGASSSKLDLGDPAAATEHHSVTERESTHS